MCGRARCTVRVDAVAAACGFQAPLRSVNADRYQPSYNVAPGAHMPVIRYDSSGETREPVVHCMRWGLVPSFTKKAERPDFFRMFNARSESVHQKSSFRRLLPKNRCLAIVEGFYEWKKDGKKKQPYYVHMKDGHALVFAALYDSWENSEGEIMFTFTMLTTRVSKRLEWLHDRMPVVLGSQDAINSWLNDDLTEDAIRKLTQPYEPPDLVWYPVTPAMGRPAFNGPECVEEMKPKGASESTIAQMFGKQIAQDMSRPAAEEGSSLAIKDEDERKALLAGMEPDQDVTEALQQPEDGPELDGSIRDPEPKVDNQNPGVAESYQEEDIEVPGHRSVQTKEERGVSAAALDKEHGSQEPPGGEPTLMKAGPLASPVKSKGRKAVADAEDADPKRRRTTNKFPKAALKNAQPTAVKQKQSNLLGFFAKQ